MALPVLEPSNVVEEMFPDSFGAEGLDVLPFDPSAKARAFEPFPLTVAAKTASPYLEAGMAGPLEMIIAGPDGRHDRTELDAVPIALAFIPQTGGAYRVTVREVAHNRWWGGATIDVAGEPAS